MPIPSKPSGIGRSQSWDAAGWYDGNWEGDSAFEYQRVPGRRNSLSYGGEGAWYEQPNQRPGDIVLQGGAELKQEAYPYQDPLFHQGPVRKGSVPDFSYYERQAAMSGRSSLPPQDYYSDPALAARSPKDPRYYREHAAGRPPPSYGAPGSRLSWDPLQGRAPAAHEASRAYRDAKMAAEGQRLRSRDVSPARYGTEPPGPRYAAEAPAFPSRPVYNDAADRAVEAVAGRQTAPTCLVVDPGAAADGSVGTAAMARGYGPGREAAKVPYDGYEGAATPSHAQMPPGFPVVDSKKAFDPELLALLRAEGVSESTAAALLQQGFDSPNLLAMMEENDIKSVAPNLGQARVLSRVAHNFKMEMQLQRQERKSGALRARARSNSFSHRGELPGEYGALLDGAAAQPPFQPASPRAGDAARRPSSAPTQHLLETAALGAPCLPGATYGAPLPCSVHPRALPTYPAASTLPMAPPPLHAGPRTAYPTTYTVPMELMKRERTASPAHSPHGSPQPLRKQGAPGEPAPAPAGAGFAPQPSPCPKLSRRTGPPVIVSTMASPEPSNSPSVLGRCEHAVPSAGASRRNIPRFPV
ncbi:uncharacterized protein ACNFOS_004660 [Eudromia elegans]